MDLYMDSYRDPHSEIQWVSRMHEFRSGNEKSSRLKLRTALGVRTPRSRGEVGALCETVAVTALWSARRSSNGTLVI